MLKRLRERLTDNKMWAIEYLARGFIGLLGAAVCLGLIASTVFGMFVALAPTVGLYHKDYEEVVYKDKIRKYEVSIEILKEYQDNLLEEINKREDYENLLETELSQTKYKLRKTIMECKGWKKKNTTR